jgi:Methyltransferase domain
MALMLRHCPLNESTEVLDLGGNPNIWNFPAIPKLSVTILNLPGHVHRLVDSRHTFRYIEGDGCDVRGITDQSFDFVFSNSVIEHVGDRSKRADFAREVRRIGISYWVQTPSIWFPIEAHNGMPLWWFYPKRLRRALIDRWRRKLPSWTDMVENTDIVLKSEFSQLFPEADIIVERVFGIPKSYIAVYVPKWNSA